MKMCNIYGIIDPREKEEYRYVGKTPFSLKKRLGIHISEAKRKGKKKVKTHKCNWVRKLLRNNVPLFIKLIDTVPMKEWAFWEAYYIKLYKNLGHRLTNGTNGGDGIPGHKHTKKVRKLLREANLGKHPTKKTRKLISKALSGKNNPMFGKHHTKESNEKNRQSHLGKMIGKDNPFYGKTHTKESNEKNRQSHLGKYEGKNNPFYDKKHTEQTIKNMKVSQKKRRKREAKEKLNKVV